MKNTTEKLQELRSELINQKEDIRFTYRGFQEKIEEITEEWYEFEDMLVDNEECIEIIDSILEWHDIVDKMTEEEQK